MILTCGGRWSAGRAARPLDLINVLLENARLDRIMCGRETFSCDCGILLRTLLSPLCVAARWQSVIDEQVPGTQTVCICHL
jgi:hypothetical protein